MELDQIRAIEESAEKAEFSALSGLCPDQMLERYQETLRDAPRKAETPEQRVVAQSRKRVFFEVVALRFALKPNVTR